jgi:HD-like signal output (HDOD) protein/prolyl-tRNA editing enzyme YbaK/EbsC (Cys-tRNA(Pro) deacylase)
MSISATLRKLFAKHQVLHKIYNHPRMPNLLQAATWHKISTRNVIDAQVLVANGYHILVVYPFTHTIDIDYLNDKLNKKFKLLEPRLANKIFYDCEPGLTTPFGYPYKLDIILDKNIEKMSWVYFNGGAYTSLVAMSLNDFLFLNMGALRLHCAKKVAVITDKVTKSPNSQLLLKQYDLPAVPPIIRHILELASNQQTNIQELLPLLVTENDFLNEILGNVNLDALVAYSEPEHSLQKFSELSKVVIGVSTGKALLVDDLNAVDLKSFWVHSFMAAALAEDLTKQVTTMQLDHRISYLAGIFHNIGFVLLAKLFTPEFKLLQKWQQLNPEIPIQVLEKKLLGMGNAFYLIKGGHAELGQLLLRSWNLSEAICEITGQHHNLNYSGQYSAYVKILQITNHLLKCQGIGDGSLTAPSQNVIESLGLDQEKLNKSLSSVLHVSQDIEKLTKAITK